MSDLLVSAVDGQGNKRTILAGTTAETVYTCPDDQIAKGMGLHICNTTAGTITYTVDVHDGTTAYVVKNAVSLATNESAYVDLRGTRLTDGETIRVTAAANVHVIADCLESGRQ